jgi:outer membrane protein, heavy metal efflux system
MAQAKPGQREPISKYMLKRHLISKVVRYQCARIAIVLLLLLPSLVGRAFSQQPGPASRVSLEDAIQLAIAHNHALKAARTQIQQSQAQETTAAIHPNPVLTWDALFLPLFSPASLNADYLNSVTEYDLGLGYTFERGNKRQARITAARDQTAVTRSEVDDNERTLAFNVAQLFISALQAKSTLEFAQQDLASFQQTVDIGQESFRAGQIGEGDLLKIKLQLLQFQTDVSSAKLALVQALAGLRQQLGYDAVAENYDIIGELSYSPLSLNEDDLKALALRHRPDLLAAQQGITAAQSQFALAQANGKRDLTTTLNFSRLSGTNNLGFIFNIEIPFFDRNQGEIARTQSAITQSQETKTAAEETVLTDVANAYEASHAAAEIVQLYESGYLKQAQDSRDISEYAYHRGAASLLDFLDAERSYRATQLAYRQALASYMLGLEQLRQVVGTRNLQ